MNGTECGLSPNLLLAHLAPNDFDALASHFRRVVYPVGAYIGRSGAQIDTVMFPQSGVCALLIPARDRHLAVGMIGREGLVGASILHGARTWRHDVVARACDVAALEIDAARLREACRASAPLFDLLLRFAGCFLLQVSRATVTNLVEPLEKRLARWILLYHDRLDGDEIAMTHQEIGIMLGVRRASATDTLHILEGLGAIRSERCIVSVRNRVLLEELAGESYGDAEADYRQLIGPFGKTRATSRGSAGTGEQRASTIPASRA